MGYRHDDVLEGQNRDSTGKEGALEDEEDDAVEPIYGDLEVEDFNTLWRN